MRHLKFCWIQQTEEEMVQKPELFHLTPNSQLWFLIISALTSTQPMMNWTNWPWKTVGSNFHSARRFSRDTSMQIDRLNWSAEFWIECVLDTNLLAYFYNQWSTIVELIWHICMNNSSQQIDNIFLLSTDYTSFHQCQLIDNERLSD